MNAGEFVFAQLLDLIHPEQFHRCIQRDQGKNKAKSFFFRRRLMIEDHAPDNGSSRTAVLATIPLNLDSFIFRPEFHGNWKRKHITSRPAADFAGC